MSSANESQTDGALIATSSSMIALGERHKFDDLCGDFHRHDPEGNMLYGLNLALDPGTAHEIARRLYDAREELGGAGRPAKKI